MNIPQEIKEQAYFIPHSDWDRLKRMIKRICPERRLYIILSSIAFGIFASAIIALILLYGTASTLPSWVLPTSWVFLVVSLVLGIALWILDGQQQKVITVSTLNVIEEMTSIEEKFKEDDEAIDDEDQDEKAGNIGQQPQPKMPAMDKG